MSEHEAQSALFEWAQRAAVEFPALRWMFAIPNGGHRHPAVAVQLQQEGVKPGVPDIFLPLPRYCGEFVSHGLFIELKVGRNKASERQREWLAYLCDAGYLAVVCYGWRDAAAVILDYLDVADDDKARLLGDASARAAIVKEG